MEPSAVNDLIEFLSTPAGQKVALVMFAYYVFNSAVQALPSPENGGKFYRWLFNFTHALAGNWGLLMKIAARKGK